MPRVSAAYLEERRAHVLASAARCFAREGFHRATMQDVVRESGLSPGALYRYFASKEELVAAIAEERHAAESAALDAARGRGRRGRGARDRAGVPGPARPPRRARSGGA